MSGKIYRASAPDVTNDLLDATTSELITHGDTHREINISEQDSSSIYDQSIVTPITTHRYTQSVIQPTDTNSRVQRLEFVIDNHSVAIEQHIKLLNNTNNIINKQSAAIKSTYNLATTSIDKIKKIHAVLLKIDNQVKVHTSDLREISDIKIANITRDLNAVIKRVNSHTEIMREQYEELKSAINDAHSFIEDLNTDIAANTKTIVECKEAITVLSSKLGTIDQLIDNYILTKRIIIRIAIILSTTISTLYTIYSTGILSKILRFIISSP